MSYTTRVTTNEHGDPMVTLVAAGIHDVSRLANLLAGSRMALCEHLQLETNLRRQLRNRRAGRAALALLAEHGGPDLAAHPVGPPLARIPVAAVPARPVYRRARAGTRRG